MPLPLLERVPPDGLTFALTKRSVVGVALRERRGERMPPSSVVPHGDGLPKPQSGESGRMPQRAPGPGEQYRFPLRHEEVHRLQVLRGRVQRAERQPGRHQLAPCWRDRRGWFPNTTRAYLSMGCNHCLEPTCLGGCPVDVYSKDPATGIVRHSADACIGCQYCTWNCSYGVPQYNAARGVVGKCDMCHGRLSLGQAPANTGTPVGVPYGTEGPSPDVGHPFKGADAGAAA